MRDDEAVVELRFDSDARASLETSVACLKALDIEVSDTARDPTLLAALTVAASVATMVTELIKLAHELRAKNTKQRVVLVKIDKRNKEKSISFLDVSDQDIAKFLSDD